MSFLYADYENWFKLYFLEFNRTAPKEFLCIGYEQPNPNGTAASLQSIITFANIVNNPDAVILDSGAGSTSFVLRKIFKNVISTDTNEKYLFFIKNLCGNNLMSTEGFIHGLKNCPACDYVFYDYGGMPDRMANLELAWEKTKKIMYADDADDRPHGFPFLREAVYLLGARERCCIRDCREAIDKWGRWGVTLERQQND